MANILEEVQRYVADKLNADEQLSGCTFLVENMKDIDYEIKKALGKQGLVGLVMTPKAVYQGKYEDLFLAWQLDELEIDIVENPIVNRGQLSSHITGQDAAMRLFDVLCPAIGDSEGQFNPVSYEEGEDSGLIVNKCILKALVYGESQDPPQPTPPLNMRFVKLLDEVPPLSVTRQEGWMWPTDDGYVIWQDGEAHQLGTPFEQITAYVESAVSAKADLSTLEDYIPYAIDNNGSKSALTIGTRTPNSSVGQFSFSTGANNAAEALQTVAMGFNNKALMQDSIAIGQNNNVAGSPAVAIGKDNKVSCTNGVSIGVTNTISGVNAVAIGTLNNANGDYAIAMGGKARANSDGSFTWSGSDKINVVVYPQYFDHGKGTFNVNPAGGLSGFYVGEQSLNDILSAKADLSAIHGDYITNGESTISANRAWSEKRGYVWTVTINLGTYVLSCNEDGTSTWDQCELLEDSEGYEFWGRTIGCYEDDILFFKLEYDIEGAVFHLTMKDKRDSWPADEYTLVPDEPLMQYLPHGPFGNWDAIVSYMPWTKTGILTTKDYVDEAIETYAVQNLGGVAKIQSMELSDYQAISATADLSTLYVIPEET